MVCRPDYRERVGAGMAGDVKGDSGIKPRIIGFGVLILACCLGVLGCSFGSSSGGSTWIPFGSGNGGIISGRVVASQALPLSALRLSIRGEIDVVQAYVWLAENNLIATYTDASGAFFLSGVPIDDKGYSVVAKFEVGQGKNKKVYKIKSEKVKVDDQTTTKDAGNLELKVADRKVVGVMRDENGKPIPNATLELWGETFTTGPNGEFETPPLPDIGVPIEKIEVKQALGYQPTSILTTFGNNTDAVTEIVLSAASQGQGTAKLPQILLYAQTPADTMIPPGSTVPLWAIMYFSDFSDPSGLIDSWKPHQGSLASATRSVPEAIRKAIVTVEPSLTLDKAKVTAVVWTAPGAGTESLIQVWAIHPSGNPRQHAQLKLYTGTGVVKPEPAPNTPPTVSISGPAAAQVKATCVFSAVAQDAQADLVSYAWSVSPTNGTIAAANAVKATWTPNATGVYELRCTVTELRSENPLSAVATFSVLVSPQAIIVEPGKISGHLIDDRTAAPIGGGLVIIVGTQRSTITNADGYFEFKNLPPGTYDLVATRDGYQGKTFPGIVVP